MTGRRTVGSLARRRRAAALVAVAGLVAALAAGLVVAVSPRRAATAQEGAAVTVQRAHAGSATPAFKQRIVLLTIGSDSGAPKFGRGGNMESGRADARTGVSNSPSRPFQSALPPAAST